MGGAGGKIALLPFLKSLLLLWKGAMGRFWVSYKM